MPSQVNTRNPELTSLQRRVDTKFEEQRVKGLGKVPVMNMDQLPKDNSLNIAIARDTSKGFALVFFEDGADWLFSDDYSVMS